MQGFICITEWVLILFRSVFVYMPPVIQINNIALDSHCNRIVGLHSRLLSYAFFVPKS